MISKSTFRTALDAIIAAGYEVHNDNMECYNAAEIRGELDTPDWSDDAVESPDAQTTLRGWLKSTAIVADRAARTAAHDGKDAGSHVAVRDACSAALEG